MTRGFTGTLPVASGCVVPAVDTIPSPSGVIRTDNSASTSRSVSARSVPNNSAMPDRRTSAFGALATIALL